MSDNYLILIPTDPVFVPPAEAQEQAHKLLARSAPRANEVTHNTYDETTFIDQGANFERVICPFCEEGISKEWWHGAMDSASNTHFADLAIVTPCCKRPTTLNDLRYDWPAGFSRFDLRALNPDIPDVPVDIHHKMETVLGCKLRRIWAHY